MRASVAELAARHGLELVGVADAAPLPDDRRRMEASVAAGRMGRMDWMGGDRPSVATDPTAHDPTARSVVVVAAPYGGADRAAWDPDPAALARALASVLAAAPSEPAGRIARYALGTDYHVALRQRLEGLAADLRTAGLPAGNVAYVDDRPLAERALAARRRSGLDRQEHQPAHAPSRRLLGLPRRDPHVGGARGRSAGSLLLRQLHAMPGRLPDRRPPLGPHHRCRPMHQLPDHRASGRPRAVGGVGHRRLDLRLRRLPGGLSGERGRRRRRAAAGPVAAAHRVAAAARRPRLRPCRRGLGTAPGRPASAAAQRGRRSRECRPVER